MNNAYDLLGQARARYTQRQLGELLKVSARTVARWERNETALPTMLAPALREVLGLKLAVPNEEFTFIDLFAGIGGIRMGYEAHGGKCVFTSEWNSFAEKTYLTNFPDEQDEGHSFIGDIQQHDAALVPDHDVLLGGFPCQPFSIAGVSKKNALGLAHGFEDATQGTLFFDVARIIDEKRPAAFMLENVKNLRSHDKGKTFSVIMATLQEELGYEVHTKVIDGISFTPQHRERIVIVGFREPTDFSWDDLELPPVGPKLETVLHRTDGTEPYLEWDAERYFNHESKQVQPKFTLTPKLWSYLQAYAAKHKAAGNGFGFGLVHPNGTSRTLSARYYKDGSEILVAQGTDRPRRLTPRECARLMGFDDSFRIPVSDTQAYRQFGNSVVAPVMQEVARIVVPHVAVVKAKQDLHGESSTAALMSSSSMESSLAGPALADALTG